MAEARRGLMAGAAVLIVSVLALKAGISPREPKHAPADGRDRRYETPEKLVDDFERATRGLSSTEGLMFPLARYCACAALREGSDARCAKLDRFMPVPHEGRPTCGALYHQALMLKASVDGSDWSGPCAALARLQEAGRDDADTPAQAAEFCRKLAPHYAGGDPEGACDLMFREDGAYGEDPETGKPLGRRACLDENAFLLGDPVRCPAVADAARREHCRAKASLIRALKKKAPRLVERTMYAPLLDRGALCEDLGWRALAEYETMRRGT